jgi:antitoxin component of MazEF toxin-antitoxin module
MARRKGAKPIRVADSGPAPQQVAIPATERMVNTEDVVDIHPIHDVTTGKRKVLTLPADLCRRLGIREGTPLRIVEYEGRFEVTPMRLVPAIDNPAEGLEVLVAGITPENIHGEFDTGPAVGQESW